MKNQRYALIILLILLALFMHGSVESEKSLAEIYKSGTVRFVPVLTIDDASMPEGTFFESVIDVACDNDGNVYACDYRANNIKIFDSSGKYIKTIGSKGQGPGEFNMPFKIAVSDDRLIVWDMMNSRLCAFTPDGEFINSVAISMLGAKPKKMRSLPNGDVVIELEKIYYRELDKPQDRLIEIYSPDLKSKMTMYTQQILRRKYRRIEGRRTGIIQPFSPDVYWDVTPEGKIIIGYSKKYEIEIYESTGRKISSFVHSFEPVKVTDKDKDIFFAGGVFNGGGTVKKSVSDRSSKYREFPKYKPPYQRILIDSEGNILVLPYRKNRKEESRFFDAFDPAGNFISNVKIVGELKFPKETIIKDGSFWSRRVDKEGFSKIVKYRISD